MYQNHVGDDEPGDELVPRRETNHVPAQLLHDKGFRAEAEDSLRQGEGERFLSQEADD